MDFDASNVGPNMRPSESSSVNFTWRHFEAAALPHQAWFGISINFRLAEHADPRHLPVGTAKLWKKISKPDLRSVKISNILKKMTKRAM